MSQDKIVKPLTKSEDLSKRLLEANQKATTEFAQKGGYDKAVLQSGKGTGFSAAASDIDKYMTYGTKVYGKLGYDPRRDNLKLYNKETKDYSVFQEGSDINRAWDGMWKLAKVGFQDTIGAGLFASNTNHLDFEKIMADHSSVRKDGSSAFWANTMLSSGYTAGIIGAIAAEEIAMAAGTVLTGGALGGVAGARTAVNATKLGKLFTKSDDIIRAVDAAGDINNLRKWYHPAEIGKKVASSLNPLESTFDYIKTLDNLNDAKSLKQVTLGAGAIYRDFRKISMTHGESKLEANMAKKEVKDAMIDQWYKKNPGQQLTDNALTNIESKANDVYADTYHANLGLIYATNAITFDNLFKSGKFAQKWMKTSQIGTLAAEGIGTNAARVNVIKGFWKQAGKKVLSSVHPKSVARIAAGNLMEGVQEYGQDALSGAAKTHNLAAGDVSDKIAKDWNLQSEAGKQATGGYWNYFSKDLVNALGNNYGSEGLSTFLSGAFMGGFAAPMGWTTQAVNHVTVGGGAQKGFQWVFQNKKYQAEKLSKFEQADAEAKILTDFFNNSGADYITHANHPLFEQTDIQEKMLEAIDSGDKKKLEDLREQSFALGVQTLLKRGMEKELINHLEQAANNLSPTEMGEFLNRTDVTQDNVAEHRTKILEKAKAVKQYKALYDNIEDTVINPIDVRKLSKNDPEYSKKVMQYHAFESMKKELLFSHGAITNKAKRMSELVDQLNKDSNITSTEIQALTNNDDLNMQIDLLKLEVKGNKDLELDAEGKQKQKIAEKKLNLFETYKELQEGLGNLSEYDNARRESIKNEMQDVFHELAVINDKTGTQHIGKSRILADKLFDYNNINNQHKGLQKYVNTMLDPTSISSFLTERERLFEQYNANKEMHIAESLKAFHTKAETSMMLQILQEKGVFFDMSELDRLLKKHIMPSNIYDVTTGEKASLEQVKDAQDVLKHYYKKLTGLTATEKHEDIYRETGGRFDVNDRDKRTYNDLAKEYGFDKTDVQPTKIVLQKITNSKNSTADEKALAELLLQFTPEDATVTFSDSSSRPNTFDSENGSVVDARYSSSNFTNSFFSLEESILKNEMQRLTGGALETDSEFNDKITALREQIVEYLKSEKNKDEVDQKVKRFDWKGLDNNVEFIKEAFVNKSFQGLLISINSTEQTKTTWNKLIDSINAILSKYKVNASKSVYAEVVSLVQQKVDYAELEQPVQDDALAGEEDLDAEETPTQEESIVEEEQASEPIADFDENGPIEEFPKVLLGKLIADYKQAVAKGDANGKNKEKLSETSLTKEFKNWVDDYGQPAIEKFKKLLAKPIPENISLISNEDKKRLAELGYTADEINAMSDFEIANIILKETKETSLNTDEEEVINELIDEELNIETDGEKDSEEEVNTDTGRTSESSTDGSESNQEETATEEAQGVNKTNHNKVVDRLAKGEEVIAEITGKTGVTSVRATLDTGENILFYDHANEVKPGDKGEVVTLKLVPELTLEDGRILTNVVQVYAGDRFMGNLSEKDYKKVKPVITVNATEEEIQQVAETIVANNEDLFSEKKLMKVLLKELGYSKEDIASLKKGQKMKILKNSITKEQYLEKKAKKAAKKLKSKDSLSDNVVKFLENKFDNVETEEDMLNAFNDVVNKFPNYEEELPFIKNIFNEQRNTLANRKDFTKLKVGSKLLLSGGRVVKVVAVKDKSIDVVDFNSIIENKFQIAESSFDKQVAKVINDFNKSDKDVVSRLDENNIEQLSSIFSKFTTSAFSVSDTEIADDKMLENFKACK